MSVCKKRRVVEGERANDGSVRGASTGEEAGEEYAVGWEVYRFVYLLILGVMNCYGGGKLLMR